MENIKSEGHIFEKEFNNSSKKFKKNKRKTSELVKPVEKKKEISFLEKIRKIMKDARTHKILSNQEWVEEYYQDMKKKVDGEGIINWNMNEILDKYTIQQLIWLFHFLKAKHYWVKLKFYNLDVDCSDRQ